MSELTDYEMLDELLAIFLPDGEHFLSVSFSERSYEFIIDLGFRLDETGGLVLSKKQQDYLHRLHRSMQAQIHTAEQLAKVAERGGNA